MNSGTNCISEDDFFDVWGAYVSTTGDLFCYEEIATQPRNRVWAVVESGDDEDGSWYAMPGLHYVNRLGYVLTTKSWTDETQDAFYFLDDMEHEDDDDGESLREPE